MNNEFKNRYKLTALIRTALERQPVRSEKVYDILNNIKSSEVTTNNTK